MIINVQVIVPDGSVTSRNTYRAEIYDGIFNTENGYIQLLHDGNITITDTDDFEIRMVMPSGTHVPMKFDPNDVVYRIKED